MTGTKPTDGAKDALGYVYLVHNPRTGLYKIGSARRPNVRLAALSKEMRSACVMLHTIATNAALRLEREVQSRFIDGHKGGEWFDLTFTDIELIEAVSTVFYRDAEWQPKNRLRSEFDTGSRWAKALPICGN